MHKPWEAILKDSETPRPDFLECLYHYARMLEPASLILEIGCAKGDSTIALAMGLQSKYQETGENPGHVITIEPGFRTGTFHFPDVNDPAGYSWIYDLSAFLERCQRHGVEGYVSVIAASSQDALSYWDSREIDLLFIDGAHTYQNVRLDAIWMDFVKHYGYVAVDDWMGPIEQAIIHHIDTRIAQRWTVLHESTLPKDGNMVITLLRKEKG